MDDGAATPKGPKREERDVATTTHELPPPVPIVSNPATTAATAATPQSQPLQLPAGVTVTELEGANKTIWSTLGDSSGLRQWMRKWARETGASAGVEGEQTAWSETM